MNPGDKVILTRVPSGLLDGLPTEDQDAINAIVGQPVTFAGFEDGAAELKFVDKDGDRHTIWVAPDLLQVI